MHTPSSLHGPEFYDTARELRNRILAQSDLPSRMGFLSAMTVVRSDWMSEAGGYAKLTAHCIGIGPPSDETFSPRTRLRLLEGVGHGSMVTQFDSNLSPQGDLEVFHHMLPTDSIWGMIRAMLSERHEHGTSIAVPNDASRRLFLSELARGASGMYPM